jgi:GrpB-like predicted nucleotidyltransferase (UPF0157 family)
MDDPVVIVEYDPDWPCRFETEATCIRQILGTAAVGIEHIGSTSVPGLAAKPVIDIAIAVRSQAEGEKSAPALEALGYEFVGEHGLPGRLFFRKGSHQSCRTHHLHLVDSGPGHWEDYLAFRDFLRSHPDEAANYEQLKRGLAAQFRDRREDYTSGKSGYIAGVLAKASGGKP